MAFIYVNTDNELGFQEREAITEGSCTTEQVVFTCGLNSDDEECAVFPVNTQSFKVGLQSQLSMPPAPSEFTPVTVKP